MTGINIIFHTIQPGGGMERYCIDLIRSLTEQGIAIRAICRKFNWPKDSDLKHLVEFIKLPNLTPFSRVNNFIFEKTAYNHINKAWPTIAISRIPQGADIAITGGTHIGHLHSRKKTHHTLFDRLTIKNEKNFYNKSNIIIAHSQQTASEVVKHYNIEKEKALCLYPPIDIQKFSLSAQKERNNLRKRLNIKDNEILLLFPSNDHTRKGLDLILSAQKNWPPHIKIAIAGRELKNKTSNIISLGFVKDMPSMYAAADATILASKYEPFGLVGPESILCGTPAILANTIGATEVLTPPACIQFERTENGLKKAIDYFIELHNKKQYPISNPEENVNYSYSICSHTKKILELIKK
ncbi:glycosyltransferase family 4 protein [Laribacter hongkongensis]|uniref:glycosyltransferase family 4 protein n=1 Tax=Laribacter hongkongensis TaxID=168471 RepID=UPI0018785E65|nr:glycosyltransferase family 4 protein [Laribacter hongkongensis]